MAKKLLFNEIDMQFQIDHMIAFIDQEAREKIFEIEGRAEEEFNIEKGNLIQRERLKIKEHYQRKEENVEINKGVQNHGLLNKARLDLLSYREKQLNNLLISASDRMADDIQSIDNYQPILFRLLLQGLLKALETHVIVRCIERDIEILNDCFSDAGSKFKELTGKDITMAIDVDHFLLEYEIGGVEIMSLDGNIKVRVTLRSRLTETFNDLLPDIRKALLGPNPHRKFLD